MDMTQAMGERVNQARSTIQYLKNTIEQVRCESPTPAHASQPAMSHYDIVATLRLTPFHCLPVDATNLNEHTTQASTSYRSWSDLTVGEGA